MPDQGQRTEKPTKRRLEKARKEGSFPVSREFISAVQFLAFVWIFVNWSGYLLDRDRAFARTVFTRAFHVQLDRTELVRFYREALFSVFVPILLAGGGLLTIVVAGQLGATELGVSLQKLAPDFKRLNPLQKLRDMPQQGLSSLTQTLLLIPILGYAVYRIAADNLTSYLALPLASLDTGLEIVAASYRSLLWKAAFVLLLLASVDLLRQRSRHAKGLRMSKQELKEEMKETEGNPQMKMRIRRLQRDAARRNMMKAVPKATAVIVNPTHYAVAILYEMESMAAPRVVAKGKNYLARRIREIAISHQVPIVENQPLAQALYKSAEVGQEIPPQLYRAIAEILAYLFKLMHQGRR